MKVLSKMIVNKLVKKKLLISFAESCTGGLLASKITSVSGASKVLNLSLIAYSNQSKINILKIPKKVIKRYGAVSKQVCLSMVKNIYKISKSNISLAITGIAGPDGGTKNKPVGLVYVGIKKGNKILIKKFLIKNKGRDYIQKTAVEKSLKLILAAVK